MFLNELRGRAGILQCGELRLMRAPAGYRGARIEDQAPVQGRIEDCAWNRMRLAAVIAWVGHEPGESMSSIGLDVFDKTL